MLISGATSPTGFSFGLGLLSPDGWSQISPKWPPQVEFTLMIISETFASNVLPQQQATVATPPPPHHFPRISSMNCSQVRPRFLWSLCFVLGPSAHESLCAPFKSGVSISPSPIEILCTSPIGLNAKCSGGSSFQCQIPRLGNMRLRTLPVMGKPL